MGHMDAAREPQLRGFRWQNLHWSPPNYPERKSAENTWPAPWMTGSSKKTCLPTFLFSLPGHPERVRSRRQCAGVCGNWQREVRCRLLPTPHPSRLLPAEAWAVTRINIKSVPLHRTGHFNYWNETYVTWNGWGGGVFHCLWENTEPVLI